MERCLCFKINEDQLYLEQVLVDYMDIPVLFLCRGNDHYYTVLCTDIEELNYIIVLCTDTEIYNLLHGQITMRNIFLSQREFWTVKSGECIAEDAVFQHDITELDESMLPEKNAYFEILTQEVKNYAAAFDKKFWQSGFSDEKNIIVSNNENTAEVILSGTFYVDTVYHNIGEYSAGFLARIQAYYDSYMEMSNSYIQLKKTVYKLEGMSEQWDSVQSGGYFETAA